MTTKYKIRECADEWTLDIPFPDEVVSLFFQSKFDANLVKSILEWENAHQDHAIPHPQTPSGEPLTLEQLREMDGKPVWIDTGNQYSDWGKVDFKRFRVWPFGQEDAWWDFGHYGEWKPYAYPPSHIDREAWEPCELCKGRRNPCTENNCYEKHGGNIDCSTTCKDRIKWDFIVRNIKFNKFCPNCGRPLTEEDWAMLEKKLTGGG